VKIVIGQIKIISKMISRKKAWNQNKIQKFSKNLINKLLNNQKNKLKMKNHIRNK